MKDEALRICKEVLVKPFEGCAKVLPNGMVKAYPDPGTRAKPWTIGYGSTGHDIGPETVWTMEQCEKALDEHLDSFYNGLIKLSPTLLKASPKRVAAILSFVYNCGLGNYRISTLKKRVDEGDWEEASKEILKWDKAAGRVLRGLTRRRQAESLLLR